MEITSQFVDVGELIAKIGNGCTIVASAVTDNPNRRSPLPTPFFFIHNAEFNQRESHTHRSRGPSSEEEEGPPVAGARGRGLRRSRYLCLRRDA